MPTAIRPNLRNVAIIAHVDHGKTTLVDAMLAQTGVISGAATTPCVLDSDPLERERGITIFSKNCAVTYHAPTSDVDPGTPSAYRINLLDTPGHADFGGEVERVLQMADSALLLVDAFEGPMPQTRFVLQKALNLGLRPIVVINKCDRPEARPDGVIDEVFDLLVSLGADDHALDFPIVYASGRDGWASLDSAEPSDTIEPLLQAIIEHVPAPRADLDAPLQMLVTTLDYSEYVGRIAIGRVNAGVLRAGQPVTICGANGKRTQTRALRVLHFEGLGRTPCDEVEAGDLCAIEGLGEFELGDTITAPDHPVPLPRVAVDEPTVHMMFRINDGPLSGTEGKYVTSRQIADRLNREIQTNVALRVEPGDSGEEFRVSGRGLLHLGIVIENMRREGYELNVGRPEVIEREIDGRMHEPVELLRVDVANECMGPVMEQLGERGGEITSMEQRGDRMWLQCEIPARGLIGLRSRIVTATGGDAVMDQGFLKYAPSRAVERHRNNGVMIATESGRATTYALLNLADRGVMFIEPNDVIYAGQVVGEHNRDNDLPVNVVKAKAFSNMREATKEATVVLKAARPLTLESALEYIEPDELVEVTPESIRIRKKLLNEADRRRADRARKAREASNV